MNTMAPPGRVLHRPVASRRGTTRARPGTALATRGNITPGSPVAWSLRKGSAKTPATRGNIAPGSPG
jgi:hypothetical protein